MAIINRWFNLWKSEKTQARVVIDLSYEHVTHNLPYEYECVLKSYVWDRDKITQLTNQKKEVFAPFVLIGQLNTTLTYR